MVRSQSRRRWRRRRDCLTGHRQVSSSIADRMHRRYDRDAYDACDGFAASHVPPSSAVSPTPTEGAIRSPSARRSVLALSAIPHSLLELVCGVRCPYELNSHATEGQATFDRLPSVAASFALFFWPWRPQGAPHRGGTEGKKPVSYTHLALPTT